MGIHIGELTARVAAPAIMHALHIRHNMEVLLKKKVNIRTGYVKKHSFWGGNEKKLEKVFVNSKISINFAPFLKAKHVLLF